MKTTRTGNRPPARTATRRTPGAEDQVNGTRLASGTDEPGGGRQPPSGDQAAVGHTTNGEHAAGATKTATDRHPPGGAQAADNAARGDHATAGGHAADRHAVGGRVAVAHLNEVHVIGRVSGAPEVRPLAAGELVVWRMAVERPRPPDGARRSDWITCAAAYPGPGTNVRGLRVGDVLEIHGTLRRRFWRSRNGPVTPLEVEVRRAEPVVSAAEAAP